MRTLFFIFLSVLFLNINAEANKNGDNKEIIKSLFADPTLNKATAVKGADQYFYPEPSYDVYDNKVFIRPFKYPINIPAEDSIITEETIRKRQYIWFKEIFLNNNYSHQKLSNNLVKIIDACLKIYFYQEDAPNIKTALNECGNLYSKKERNYIFLLWYAELLARENKQDQSLKVYSLINNMIYGKSIPPLHKFIKFAIHRETKNKKIRRKNIGFLVKFLNSSHLQTDDYHLILRLVRELPNQKDTWNYLYHELKKDNSHIPEWFYKIIAGNYELYQSYEYRLKALKSRWNKDYQDEKKYWLEFNRHIIKAKKYFNSSWLLKSNSIEAAMGMLKINKTYCADLDNPQNKINVWFNFIVCKQVDYLPAYKELLSAYRSADWGESRIMKCAEYTLKDRLFDTRTPDMYLYGLILAASDYRFAWQATFKYPRVFKNLQYYFQNKLKMTTDTKGKNLIIARKIQMYRLCGKYNEVHELLEQLPPDYDITNVFEDLYYDSAFAVLKRSRQEVIGEIEAYNGKNRELLQYADRAVINGLGPLAEKLLKIAISKEKNDKAKSYLVTRLGMNLAGRAAEYMTTPDDLPSYCAKEYKFDAIKFLSENNYNLNRKNSSGRYPLGYLLYKRSKSPNNSKTLKMVDVLLKSGAEIDSKDKYLNTPLHYAAANNKFLPITKLLIDNNADINAANINKNTPLAFSCRNNNIEIAEYLLSLGKTQVNSTNTKGYTPLAYAAYKSTPELIEKLIRHGAKLDLQTSNKWSPLGLAVYYDKYENAKVLIEAGADLKTGAGTTSPLNIAVSRNKPELVKLLLKSGANPYLKDKSGKNTFNYLSDKQAGIKKLLKQHTKK